MTSKVFFVGFMGSGKSTLGRLLAEQLHYDFVDLDHWIEQQQGVTISRLFSTIGEAGFRILEKEALQQLVTREHLVLACGGGTPCHHQNMDWMNSRGVTVFINPAVDVLVHRLQTQKSHRPLIAEMDLEALSAYIETKLTERMPFYVQAQIQLISMEFPADMVKWLVHALQTDYSAQILP